MHVNVSGCFWSSHRLNDLCLFLWTYKFKHFKASIMLVVLMAKTVSLVKQLLSQRTERSWYQSFCSGSKNHSLFLEMGKKELEKES